MPVQVPIERIVEKIVHVPRDVIVEKIVEIEVDEEIVEVCTDNSRTPPKF